VNYEGVDASYFDTIGLPILRGRGIDRRDREASQPVVVVNETFARTFCRARIRSGAESNGVQRNPTALGSLWLASLPMRPIEN
jgi:hypothetical protein